MSWWIIAYLYVSGVMIVGLHLEMQAKTYELLRNRARTRVEAFALVVMLVLWPLIPVLSIIIAIKQIITRKK